MRGQSSAISLLLIAGLFFGLGVLGRESAGAQELEGGEQSATAVVTTQTLGVARAVPLISLWSRAREARRLNAWDELQRLLDTIETLSPHSVMVSYHRARVLGVGLAERQDDAEAQWHWIAQGYDVIDEAIAKHPRSAKPWETACELIQIGGPAFPWRTAERVDALLRKYPPRDLSKHDLFKLNLGEEDVAARAMLEQSVNLRTFLRSIISTFRFEEMPGFETLSEEEKLAALRGSLLLASCMQLAAMRGAEEPRHRDTGLSRFALVALHRSFQATGVNDPRREWLIKQALRIVREEYLRLLAAGGKGRAERFKQSVKVLDAAEGDWLEGLIEPALSQ